MPGARDNPAEMRELQIERMYQRILMDLCMNRFKWTGAEDTGISVRWLEMTLLRFGLAIVFQPPALDRIIAIQGAPAGNWNYIQDPTAYTVMGNNLSPLKMSGNTLSVSDKIDKETGEILQKGCVPIWSNYMRVPDLDIIEIYSKRLAQLDRSIEINSMSARRTRVAFANENQRLSVVNINRQIDAGESLIQVNADLYQDGSLDAIIKAMDLGVDPDTIEKLHILRTRIWGECMGFLGFDFANQDKKERLVASEVDANNSQVDGMRFVNLNARRDACQLINKKFGTSIGVEYHITSETSVAMTPPPPPASVGGAE
jgi:hypothetical protein